MQAHHGMMSEGTSPQQTGTPHYRREAIDHQRWRFLSRPNAHLRPSTQLMMLIVFLVVAIAALLTYTTYDAAGEQRSLATYVLRSLLGH